MFFLEKLKIKFSAHAIGIAFRSFVDRVCPGALVISLSDCVNDPFVGFHQSILDSDFVHHLSDIRKFLIYNLDISGERAKRLFPENGSKTERNF